MQVTYETNHIFLLCDSAMSKALIFLFFMYFNVIEKKNIILEELQIVKKKKYLYVKSVKLLLFWFTEN